MVLPAEDENRTPKPEVDPHETTGPLEGLLAGHATLLERRQKLLLEKLETNLRAVNETSAVHIMTVPSALHSPRPTCPRCACRLRRSPYAERGETTCYACGFSGYPPRVLQAAREAAKRRGEHDDRRRYA